MRNYGIDFLRIICVFSVIVIHASFGDVSSRDLILRRLPYANACFAFLAGWYMSSVGLEYLRRRVHRLFIPYVIWTVLSLSLHAVEAFRTGNTVFPPWSQLVYDIFFGRSSVQLWFVISLFYFQMILVLVVMFVHMMWDRINFMHVVLAIFICSTFLFSHVHGVFRCILFFGVYTSLGILCRIISLCGGMIDFFSENKSICFVCFIISAIILVLFICNILKLPSLFNNVINFEIIIWCITFGLGGMCLRNYWFEKLVFYGLFNVVSKGVMGIYLVHWLVLRLIFKPILNETMDVIGYSCGVILFNSFATFVISCLIVYCTHKWKYIWG